MNEKTKSSLAGDMDYQISINLENLKKEKVTEGSQKKKKPETESSYQQFYY